MNKQNKNVESEWWGSFDFLPKTRLQFQCADLLLDLACNGNDWLMQHELKTSQQSQKTYLHSINTDDAAWELKNQKRFVSQKPAQKITLQPAMSDRPIVCRPTITVVLLPKEEISLYVGLPLWLKLFVDDINKPLFDIPTERISDTWFGPNSREGVMAYASHASEQLETQPLIKHGVRATVELKIKNQSDDMLILDKVSVPAPNLGLYVDNAGKFWTRRITIIREGDENASLTIDHEMSCGLADKALTLVTGPRDDLGKNKITKALWALFG